MSRSVFLIMDKQSAVFAPWRDRQQREVLESCSLLPLTTDLLSGSFFFGGLGPVYRNGHVVQACWSLSHFKSPQGCFWRDLNWMCPSLLGSGCMLLLLGVNQCNLYKLSESEDVGLKMEKLNVLRKCQQTVKCSSLILLTCVKVCVCSGNCAELFNLSVLKMMFG